MSKDIVIIKIGTGVLTREEDGTLDEASLVRLVTSISELVAKGIPCVMVSSGAVGAGVEYFSTPSETRDKLDALEAQGFKGAAINPKETYYEALHP
jgi:glutamate 5-kinase